MRQHLVLAAFATLTATTTLFAQTIQPGPANILLQEVEVRSGPSKTFFATSKLNRNDSVQILRAAKEDPGWYEIVPPKGSFSWINSKYVKQIDARHGAVECDPVHPVQVLPGSRLPTGKPNRVSITLTQGVSVVIVDRPMQVDGETWLPIEPQPQEVRYIPAEAVQPAKVVTPTIVASKGWSVMKDGYTTNPTLAAAEDARQQGDLERARKLFQEVQATSTDASQKQLATNRLESMKQPQASPFQTTSNAKPSATHTALSPTPTNLAQAEPAKWSPYGRLRERKLPPSDYGQPLYTLEDEQGRVLAYVTNLPGKSLSAYVGRMISVYGPIMYRPDSAVRLRYIVASHYTIP